eukprot:TRINITY_DN3744_c0_g1_i8.p1 TRINITY_DN3744_c0_g1~~TRINITY_DN3744_c0_g1_i8.p1  ORF type:complete len:298 (-),score=128.56 TRINITY_DN3744_c0_g1_i8:1173-2066(-)
MQAEAISKQIANSDINNNIQVIDDAFMQMMNCELYQQATEYKQKELEEMRQKEEMDKARATERKMQDKRRVIEKLREENFKKAEELAEAKKDADQLVNACSGKLENISLYRKNLDAGNYMLEEMKRERAETMERKLKELEELKNLKREVIEGSTNYKKEIQEKKDKIGELNTELRQNMERSENSERLLSRIILMLKRMVPALLPEEKDTSIATQNMERYVTLYGLSLEQKAKILSFRNRSLPVESVGEGAGAEQGKVGEVEASAEDKMVEKEEEMFLKKARDKIKDRKIPASGALFL